MQYTEIAGIPAVIAGENTDEGFLFIHGKMGCKEEALDFLCECMAVVVNGKKEVWEYFDEEGIDISQMEEDEILEADEVFDLEDGRFLIVEC